MPIYSILIYSFLTLFGFLIARTVYQRDLYNREPWFAVIAALVLGGLLMAAAMWFQVRVLLLAEVRAWAVGVAGYSGLAAVTEEVFKVAAVALVAMIFRRHFDDPMDGLVYGAFAGLGAAGIESMHVVGLPTEFEPPHASELARLLGHPILTAIAGCGLGLLRISRRAALGGGAACLLFAIGLHFLYDYLVFRQEDKLAAGEESWDIRAAQFVLMLFGYLAIRTLVAVAQRWSRDTGAAEGRTAPAA